MDPLPLTGKGSIPVERGPAPRLGFRPLAGSHRRARGELPPRYRSTVPLDLAVLSQDPRFGGGAVAQTEAFLTAAEELGRQPKLLYSPNPGLAASTLTWRRIEALRQIQAAPALAREAHDARSCWVVATVAHHGAAAPRSGRSYGCWLGTTIASEWHGRARGLSRSRRIAAGSSLPILRAIEQHVLVRASRLYATSPASLAQVAAAADCSPAEIGLLPIPVDLERFAPEDDEPWLRRAELEPVIGFVGRANDPRKNVGMLLRAFALVREELPTARLRLIGQPSAGPTGAGVESTGTVPEVASLVRRCSIVVLPSFQEGFGVVVAESLASGVPVIVTPCGGPEDLVRSSGAGRVTPGWAARDLADCVLELLGDLDLLARARAAARPYVAREHAPARFRGLLAEAFHDLDD